MKKITLLTMLIFFSLASNAAVTFNECYRSENKNVVEAQYEWMKCQIGKLASEASLINHQSSEVKIDLACEKLSINHSDSKNSAMIRCLSAQAALNYAIKYTLDPMISIDPNLKN